MPGSPYLTSNERASSYREDIDFLDPKSAIEVFDQAAQANLENPLREGSTVCLPSTGRLLMTGDIHDHGINLQRILNQALLDQSEDHSQGGCLASTVWAQQAKYFT